MEKYELLLGRGTKLAKNLRIFLCQNCIKMHYFLIKTPPLGGGYPFPDYPPLRLSAPRLSRPLTKNPGYCRESEGLKGDSVTMTTSPRARRYWSGMQ